MGAKATLTTEPKQLLFGDDGIIIRQCLSSIIGGRTLDVTGFPDDVITAGHVVIYDKTAEVYKPMPVNGTAYASLPANCEYVGVVVATKTTEEPMVGIMYRGEVNDLAVKYSYDSIKSALKTALPGLVFLHD